MSFTVQYTRLSKRSVSFHIYIIYIITVLRTVLQLIKNNQTHTRAQFRYIYICLCTFCTQTNLISPKRSSLLYPRVYTAGDISWTFDSAQCAIEIYRDLYRPDGSTGALVTYIPFKTFPNRIITQPSDRPRFIDCSLVF